MNFRKICSELFKTNFIFRSISQISIKPETRIQDILRQHFPKATEIEVKDISGGCGAMFEIYVQTIEFTGLNTLKQHIMVNKALNQQIKDMHGIRIYTSLPQK
ncbi:bolA-like protein 3 [Oppia nitens]|uniref:bolA-like protein 3 n=1 Tax=Oppia nitens TaxID=1686743 RepID=UPI0023DC1AF3|nr:bolA-like protein 3 [Oppia nitens]